MLKKSTKYHLDLAFSNILYGINLSYFVSLVKNWISVESLVFIQILVSALFFVPLSLCYYRHRFTWDEVSRIVFVAIIITYGRKYLLLLGLSTSTPISASIIATLGPIFTIMIREKLFGGVIEYKFQYVGVLLAFLGFVSLLIDHKSLFISSTAIVGNIFILVSVLCMALHTIIIKPVLKRHGSLVVIGCVYFVGFAISAPLFGSDALSIDYSTMPTLTKMELTYILMFGTILPTYLLYNGVIELTSIHTAIYRYIQPLMAIVVASTRGQEVLVRGDILALAFIFSGVVIVSTMYKPIVESIKRYRSGVSGN